MPYLLTWSDRASDEYEKLTDYLIEYWGKQIANRIRLEFEEKLLNIINNPEHYQIFNKQKKFAGALPLHKLRFISKLKAIASR